MRYLPALLLAGCLHAPTGWQIVNASPEQEVQAQALVAAARTVTGSPMPGGTIRLETTPYGLDGKCGASTAHVSGCSYSPESIVVLIMPPLLGPDLVSTALPHELCHAGMESVSDAIAESCSQMVINRYLYFSFDKAVFE